MIKEYLINNKNMADLKKIVDTIGENVGNIAETIGEQVVPPLLQNTIKCEDCKN